MKRNSGPYFIWDIGKKGEIYQLVHVIAPGGIDVSDSGKIPEKRLTGFQDRVKLF
jgi:hypothetical protein